MNRINRSDLYVQVEDNLKAADRLLGRGDGFAALQRIVAAAHLASMAAKLQVGATVTAPEFLGGRCRHSDEDSMVAGVCAMALRIYGQLDDRPGAPSALAGAERLLRRVRGLLEAELRREPSAGPAAPKPPLMGS